MSEICDMCGSDIIDKKCSCGTWADAEDASKDPMKLALEKFHEMRKFTLTGDMPHLGCAVVFFRGGYNETKKVEKFIYEMNGRSYYDESDR